MTTQEQTVRFTYEVRPQISREEECERYQPGYVAKKAAPDRVFLLGVDEYNGVYRVFSLTHGSDLHDVGPHLEIYSEDELDLECEDPAEQYDRVTSFAVRNNRFENVVREPLTLASQSPLPTLSDICMGRPIETLFVGDLFTTKECPNSVFVVTLDQGQAVSFTVLYAGESDSPWDQVDELESGEIVWPVDMAGRGSECLTFSLRN